MKYFVLAQDEQEAIEWLKERFGYDAQYMEFVYVSSPRKMEGLRVRSWQVLRAPNFHLHPQNLEIEGVIRRITRRYDTPEDRAVGYYLRFTSWISEHHSPSLEDGFRYCNGCDMGCYCERASWPCSTAMLFSEKLSLGLDPDWMPQAP